MKFLPISINIENKKILIIGGGKVAYHKLKILQRFTSNITVLGREISEQIINSGCDYIQKEYEEKDLEDFLLIYAATNNSELNIQIRKDGIKTGKLVNVVDNPAFCDFVSPAIYKKENMTVAVSSNGEDVYKSIAWRDKIRDIFEFGFPRAWIKGIFRKNSGSLPISKKKTNFLKSGTVYLVGFGPGDPDLMTLKAHKSLQDADVIFYDDLLNAEILEKFDGEKVYVGKRRDNHHKAQDEINLLLLDAAKNGKKVVRLKGGDPLIFGRGIEEKKFLNSNGVPVEIIPGITSGIAAGALSGIPLTHRGTASSVAIGTAHAKNSFKILEADTSVYYMGANNLHEIVNQYLLKGYPKDFPVAIVYNVSFPDQKVTVSSLEEIIEKNLTFKSPIISIFGYSVNERIM